MVSVIKDSRLETLVGKVGAPRLMLEPCGSSVAICQRPRTNDASLGDLIRKVEDTLGLPQYH